MHSKSLHGIVPALATPLRPGSTDLDEDALATLIDFLIAAGVHGLFALGSTGEAVLFETAQRRRAVELVLARAGGRLPVFVQVGALRPAEVVELARHAEAAGAAGIAAFPPFFYGLDDAALEAFFSQLAEAVSIPVYLYNIPMNAKNPLRASLFARLSARHANVMGMKDSSMDFGAYLELLKARRTDQAVMMGNDSQILPALLMGGHGAVSAGATAVPEPYVALWRAVEAGDLAAAHRWQSVCTMVRTMFVKPYPIAPIKRVLALRGLAGDGVMPPLRSLSPAENAQLEREFAAVSGELQRSA